MYIQCLYACAWGWLLAVILTGICQRVLWKTNCNEPDESTGQYRLTPSLCAKSGHKQLPFPLSHPMEIPSDLSTHTHTFNTHEWWQLLNHTAIHTHARIMSALYTCTQAPAKIFAHAPTGFCGSETTSTHSFANESISWFHSFHCCQTPSISPFLPVPAEQQGSSEIERRRRGLKHPGSSKTPHFLSALVPQKYGVLMVRSSVYVCVWNERERRD